MKSKYNSYEELLSIIETQQETICRLNEKIEELEERLNKNSHNSSKPPSSDGYEKPSPKSQRKKSAKKPGGQTGHKGHNMILEQPDRIEKVYPTHCANCPVRENCAHLSVHQSCHVIDVQVKKIHTKYEIMKCSCDGIEEVAQIPKECHGTVCYGNNLTALVCTLSAKGMVAVKNLCEIIQGLTGIKPSEGTVINMLDRAAKLAKPIAAAFPQMLYKSSVIHCDETGVRINGKLYWVHVISTKDITYYYLSEKRGKEAMDNEGFLKDYHGIVVHDFWYAYFKATGAEHAMCGAHILRELTGIYENHPEQHWAYEMYYKLLDMCHAADFYNQNPEVDSREHYMSCLKKSYDEILERAVLQNPLPQPQMERRGKTKKGKIRALVDRLINYKDEVCRFADNSLVPFTNNQAERDLRMIKMKNKVIGCFRSKKGANDFLSLKSLTSTFSKKGFTFFQTILRLFSNTLEVGTE